MVVFNESTVLEVVFPESTVPEVVYLESTVPEVSDGSGSDGGDVVRGEILLQVTGARHFVLLQL